MCVNPRPFGGSQQQHDVYLGVRELIELTKLRTVATAARDLEETLAKLIKAGETAIKSTDIAADAIKDRLNTLHNALKVLDGC